MCQIKPGKGSPLLPTVVFCFALWLRVSPPKAALMDVAYELIVLSIPVSEYAGGTGHVRLDTPFIYHDQLNERSMM